MARSRVELFEQIRKDSRVEGSSIRLLAEKHHVHRRTVRQALTAAVPPPRKAYPGCSPETSRLAGLTRRTELAGGSGSAADSFDGLAQVVGERVAAVMTWGPAWIWIVR